MEMGIRILPLPEAYLVRVREEGLDAQGQPVRRFVSTGGDPCRDALRRSRPGEEVILASYGPFEGAGPNPYREFGPVFLLAKPETAPINRTALPVTGDHPERYFGDGPLAFRAYAAGGYIIDGALGGTADAEAAVARFLGSPAVAHVDVRFAIRGCFACRVVRA
ncbi:MAG: DUF1203 domain-containing protein [Chloroflexota bacterium]|nr:DUF1203 domain-containing protein [Chloroflexota bacterium]